MCALIQYVILYEIPARILHLTLCNDNPHIINAKAKRNLYKDLL